MNQDKWNEINFLLSENIKTDISENDFEKNVIQALRVLDWKEYSGDIDIRPSFQFGAANRIMPDFVIKSATNQKLFVIEIKQPSIPLTSSFQQQLFSYMRHLKLEYGILIGQSIQIFYDGNLAKQEDPILLETIRFEKNNKKGETFVELFKKENYNVESLKNFTIEALEKINKKQDFKELTKKIVSDNYIEKLTELIKQDFISEYDGELIDSVLKEIDINIYKKSDFIETDLTSTNFNPTQREIRRKKTGVISSIKKLITTQPKSQEEILDELVKLFPDRHKDSMRNTVRAQLGGPNQPVRIEKERNFTLIVTIGNDNIKKYSISSPSYTNSILPIELNPSNELDFKKKLLKTKRAYITTFYANGTNEKKPWNANRFSETSGVLGNLRSRPEFRNGEWQDRGIIRVYVSIEN
ncbi:hypothetical protein EV196_11338 [Mariniflexile fucanivorans]|uniref:Type I restriction enzyme R protein N-terminal domain-containing protein n=1 Tax=Mariniflexile fucanivorans TaxID=264023 RepID=A0A4R1R9X5_9FLAO|nr:type I restriction enzyme HsdR N-terminal domain-containing protein [Mariniflexile fucanivorans]TCL62496.1 hypothetical protein EV196_11338 [Mariniflexile fucanivorans]